MLPEVDFPIRIPACSHPYIFIPDFKAEINYLATFHKKNAFCHDQLT
jgi:hypothetical protein